VTPNKNKTASACESVFCKHFLDVAFGQITATFLFDIRRVNYDLPFSQQEHPICYGFLYPFSGSSHSCLYDIELSQLAVMLMLNWI
jgi:hypothetical protein